MKIILVPMLLIMLSCGSTKETTASEQPVQASVCPNNGECKLEVIKGSSLVIKTDTTGKPYYAIEPNPLKDVVKYTYNLKRVSTSQDDFYSEEIIFETDAGFSNINASDKMLFGVRCYCKGKAGYYYVKNGSVNYNNNILKVTIPPDLIDDQIINTYTVYVK